MYLADYKIYKTNLDGFKKSLLYVRHLSHMQRFSSIRQLPCLE
jgi:hypothetical protein